MTSNKDDVFGFENLEVWRKAVAFASRIYKLTSPFPRQEAFGLTMQLRRAAVSVSANIAEGNSRSTGKDKSRFLEIAYGSLSEVMSLLRVALEVGFVCENDLSSARSEAIVISRMLSGLRRAVSEA